MLIRSFIHNLCLKSGNHHLPHLISYQIFTAPWAVPSHGFTISTMDVGHPSTTITENEKPDRVNMNSLFRAPTAARAAKTLDRSLFSNTLPASAALVRDNRLLSRYMKELRSTRELLHVEKMAPIVSHPDPSLAKQGHKCLVLHPGVKPSGGFPRGGMVAWWHGGTLE